MEEKAPYRLNCQLDYDIGKKLAERSEKSKIPKVSIVALALTQYFKQQDMIDQLMESITSDPVKMAEFFKSSGLNVEDFQK